MAMTTNRAKSADGCRRNKPFCITITDNEKKLLTAQAKMAGMTRTDFILSCTVYANTFPSFPPTDELTRVWAELNRQGTNLNQVAAATNRLAKAADRGDAAPEEIHDLAEDARHLVAECREEVWAALRETKDLLAHGRITGRRI